MHSPEQDLMANIIPPPEKMGEPDYYAECLIEGVNTRAKPAPTVNPEGGVLTPPFERSLLRFASLDDLGKAAWLQACAADQERRRYRVATATFQAFAGFTRCRRIGCEPCRLWPGR